MDSHDRRGDFVILGNEGSYIVKNIRTNTFVARDINNIGSAEKILMIFFDDQAHDEEELA